MKKIGTLIALVSFITSANAQYKKASFLNKKGRTYDLGITSRMLGGGNSAAFGINFSYGKETSEKRTFHWFDLDYVQGNKFAYNTTAEIFGFGGNPSIPVVVSGKTGSTFAYRYNFGYFVLDNGNLENKILPYVTFSLGTIFAVKGNTTYEVSPTSAVGGYLDKQVTNLNIGYTTGIGAGVIYKVTGNFGIKLNAAYLGVLSAEKLKTTITKNIFVTLPNHVSISLGAHWLLDRDDD
jgi:hypothetical protein